MMSQSGKSQRSVSSTILGARIRQARRSANLSQSQLATRIGAHFTSVSDWERGRNTPSTRHLVSIARETGNSVEFFINDEDDEESDPVADLMEALRRVVRDEINAKTPEPAASLAEATAGSDNNGG